MGNPMPDGCRRTQEQGPVNQPALRQGINGRTCLDGLPQPEVVCQKNAPAEKDLSNTVYLVRAEAMTSQLGSRHRGDCRGLDEGQGPLPRTGGGSGGRVCG